MGLILGFLKAINVDKWKKGKRMRRRVRVEKWLGRRKITMGLSQVETKWVRSKKK